MHLSTPILDVDEEIIFVVRKHWLIIGVEFFAIFLCAVLPPLLYNTLTITAISSEFTPFLAPLYIIWLIILWMALFGMWTNYYLDVWTLTNKRLVAADQHGFFSRTTSSFRLERLQDVRVSIHGIVPTVLNFGALEIQTAGQESNFKIYGLPNPEGLKTSILEAAGNIDSPKV